MRHTFLITLGCLCGALPGIAMAEPVVEPYGPALVHLSIVDPQTKAAHQVYYHNRRYFISGQSGHSYALRIENETDQRLLVVLTVDGVNVVSGETGAFGQHGYILYPHQSNIIPGWLKNAQQVATFRFTPLPNSYAARTGRPDNVGVIGMAVFKEKVSPPPDNEVVVTQPPSSASWRSRKGSHAAYQAPPPIQSMVVPAPPPPPVSVPVAPPAPASSPPSPPPDTPPAEKLGTAHGETKAYGTQRITFQRASERPVALRLVEYNSLANLIAQGVVPPGTVESDAPQAFPGEGTSQRWYVPDPPASLR